MTIATTFVIPMQMPSYAALSSFAFAAFLTSALVPLNGGVAHTSAAVPGVQVAAQSVLNGIRPHTFAGGIQVALPSSAVTPAAAPVSTAAGGAPTREFMDKMTRLILTRGVDSVVNVGFVNALGLTPAGQDWADHRIGADATDKGLHNFAISRGTDQDLILSVRRSDGIVYVFRAGRDGKSLAALSFNPQTRMITMRDAAAAQQELDDEFSFWARSADKLLAGA